jgi:methionine-gamma-lyase
MDNEKRKKLTLDSRCLLSARTRLHVDQRPDLHGQQFPIYEEIYNRVLDGARKEVNIYSRCGNPSEYKFEEQMIYIENGDSCLAVASGMAAIAITLSAC